MAKVIKYLEEFYINGTGIIVRNLETINVHKVMDEWIGPDGNPVGYGDELHLGEHLDLEIRIRCDEYHQHSKDSCKVAYIVRKDGKSPRDLVRDELIEEAFSILKKAKKDKKLTGEWLVKYHIYKKSYK